MKPVVAFALAFVVATAASTGAKVVLTKPAPVAATDSSSMDSVKVEPTTASAPKLPIATVKTGPDTAVAMSAPVVTAPADTLRAAKTDSMRAKTKAVAAAPIMTHDSSAIESEKRVAKVFTSMDAKQAAKVLEHMSDADVHVILGYVGVKQAAQIMAALPPERAATLNKLSMSGRTGGGTK